MENGANLGSYGGACLFGGKEETVANIDWRMKLFDGVGKGSLMEG